ncbi:MAG: hypothetical protein K2Q45_02485 [Nitrosomonas sp.]|nr:hypothetical protein [Nitrosomonas sp.]
MEREWYALRDLLFVENSCRRQTTIEPILKAEQIKHPKAAWVHNIFTLCMGDGNINSKADAFFKYFEKTADFEALAYHAIMISRSRAAAAHSFLIGAAAKGSMFAKVRLNIHYSEVFAEEISCLVDEIIAKKCIEREALSLVGHYKFFREGDYEGAKPYFEAAALLGHLKSIQMMYNQYCATCAKPYWKWKLDGLLLKDELFDERILCKIVKAFRTRFYLEGPARMYIGKMFKRLLGPHIGSQNRWSVTTWKGLLSILQYNKDQCNAARKAVDTWCLFALRMNGKVNRDIRKKIGMLVWKARKEGDYLI